MNELLTRRLLDEWTNDNLKASNNAGQSLRNAQVIHAMGMISAIKENGQKIMESDF